MHIPQALSLDQNNVTLCLTNIENCKLYKTDFSLVSNFVKALYCQPTETIAAQRRGKLVTGGSGHANSGGYSCGTGSICHDRLMESDF